MFTHTHAHTHAHTHTHTHTIFPCDLTYSVSFEMVMSTTR